jgi:hypothetical protein
MIGFEIWPLLRAELSKRGDIFRKETDWETLHEVRCRISLVKVQGNVSCIYFETMKPTSFNWWCDVHHHWNQFVFLHQLSLSFNSHKKFAILTTGSWTSLHEFRCRIYLVILKQWAQTVLTGNTTTGILAHHRDQFILLYQLTWLGTISLVFGGSVHSYENRDRNEFESRRTHLMVLHRLDWFALSSIRSNRHKIWNFERTMHLVLRTPGNGKSKCKSKSTVLRISEIRADGGTDEAIIGRLDRDVCRPEIFSFRAKTGPDRLWSVIYLKQFWELWPWFKFHACELGTALATVLRHKSYAYAEIAMEVRDRQLLNAHPNLQLLRFEVYLTTRRVRGLPRCVEPTMK